MEKLSNWKIRHHIKSTVFAVPIETTIRGRATGLGRWLRIGGWVLVAMLVAHFCVRTVPKAWNLLNTDFPDYYLPAVVVNQDNDISRVYEWTWLEWQKDHRCIDQQVINLMPRTPFSTLALYPFAGMSALGAKHGWFLLSLGLLIVTLFLLRNMTQVSWRRIALIAALSYPESTSCDQRAVAVCGHSPYCADGGDGACVAARHAWREQCAEGAS